MIKSEYFDLAIGLAVVFFLAGMVVSGLNEGLNWVFRVRAKFLWAYLYELFNGDRANRALPRGGWGITKLWLRGAGDDTGNDKRPESGVSPAAVSCQDIDTGEWLQRLANSLDPIDAPQLTKKDDKAVTSIKNIPASSLAQSLVEILADVGRGELTRSLCAIMAQRTTEADVAGKITKLAEHLDPSRALALALQTFRKALLESGSNSSPHGDVPRDAAAKALTSSIAAIVNVADDTSLGTALHDAALTWPAGPNDAQARPVIDALSRLFQTDFPRLRIESAIGKLDPNSPIAPTIKRLWEASSRQIDGFRTGIEQYFDGEFLRLSGYFKRSIRLVTFAIGLCVAVLGSIDAISVGQNLWQNPDARQSLRQLADEITTEASVPTDPIVAPAEDVASTHGALERIQDECEKAHPVDDATITSPKDAAEAYGKVRTCVSGAIDELTAAGVLNDAIWADRHGWAKAWSDHPVLHPLGLLMTTLALMLGAPFWFDLIKRATGLRGKLARET